MDKKMTSGEIAKKAGVSQKAVRLYDEKGLLKPTDYSEGNYRLYDNEALLILEKIIALKQIGYSLEEIKDNLSGSSKMSILESLQEQIDLMEAKRYELEKSITRIKAVLARSNDEPDWDDVAEILKAMQEDQKKDEGHFYALDHTKGQIDWYVKIYNYLQLEENEKVLDLGCGFSKVWRNNWKDIPANVRVDAYDIRGSWADDFEKYVEEHKCELSDNTDIKLHFMDLEDTDTWGQIAKDGKYSMILTHYVMDVIKEPELFIKRAAEVLSDDGFMSLNDYGCVPRTHFDFWYEIFDKIGLDRKILDTAIEPLVQYEESCKKVLRRYFGNVEEHIVPCVFEFDNSEDIIKDLICCIPEGEEFVNANRKKLSSYFEKCLEEAPVEIPHDGYFYKLGK